MIAGDVIYFVDFKFSNGNIRNKLIIILNTPQNDEPYLICITTSQPKSWRTNQLGCHSDQNYYFVDSNQDNFDKDTWIVFEKVYEMEVDKLLKSCLKDGSYKLFELEPTLWKAIKNCITKSQDIEQDYLELILRNAP